MNAQDQEAGQQPVSVDPRQRMGDCQTKAVNARMRVHAALAAAGVEPDEADELVCALEAGAVAGAHCWVEELDGCAPDAHGTAYGEGFDGGVERALQVLMSTADSSYRQRGRARVTRSVLIGGEILRNPVGAADPAGKVSSRAFAQAEDVIAFVTSDPEVQEAGACIEASETELGLELRARLQSFQDRHDQAVRDGDAAGLAGACPGKHGRWGRICVLPEGHETSMEEPHWGRNSEGRPIAWVGSAPDDW